VTRDELLRLAAQAAEQAETHEKLAAQLRRQEARFREMAEEALSIRGNRSIIGSNMELATPGATKKVRIAAGRTKRNHQAKRAFLEHGKTDEDISKEVGVGRSTVNAWYAGSRSIPGKHAKHFEKKYGVPRSAWAKVAE